MLASNSRNGPTMGQRTVSTFGTKTIAVNIKLNLIPGKHVVVTDFDGGEGILVDLNTKKYFQLNETAMVVWKGLEQGKTVGEIVDDIGQIRSRAGNAPLAAWNESLTNFQTYKLLSAR